RDTKLPPWLPVDGQVNNRLARVNLLRLATVSQRRLTPTLKPVRVVPTNHRRPVPRRVGVPFPPVRPNLTREIGVGHGGRHLCNRDYIHRPGGVVPQQQVHPVRAHRRRNKFLGVPAQHVLTGRTRLGELSKQTQTHLIPCGAPPSLLLVRHLREGVKTRDQERLRERVRRAKIVGLLHQRGFRHRIPQKPRHLLHLIQRGSPRLIRPPSKKLPPLLLQFDAIQLHLSKGQLLTQVLIPLRGRDELSDLFRKLSDCRAYFRHNRRVYHA